MSVSSYNSSNSRGSWVDSQRGRSPSRGRNSRENATLTAQFAIHQHMASHYQRLQNVKAAVDTSAPKCHALRQSPRSRASSASGSFSMTRPASASTHQLDGVRCTVNRISFYLEALRDEQKRLLQLVTQQPARSSWQTGSAASSTRRSRSKDLLELHEDRFTAKQVPFTPRVLRTDATSRLRESRMYNGPVRVERDSRAKIRFDEPREAAQRERVGPEVKRESPVAVTVPEAVTTVTSRYMARIDRNARDEDDAKYLEFVVQVTDDVLSRGVFNDSTLTRVFEQHTQRRKGDLDVIKMRMALEALKADLGIGTPSLTSKPEVPSSSTDFASLERMKSRDLCERTDIIAEVNGVDSDALCGEKLAGSSEENPKVVGETGDDFMNETMERLHLDGKLG